jgi:hypothetical protein
MPELMTETPTPEQATEEPLWVQRMRARGYNIRIGTGDLPEVPEVMFTPPPRTLRNVTRSILYVLRHPLRTLLRTLLRSRWVDAALS